MYEERWTRQLSRQHGGGFEAVGWVDKSARGILNYEGASYFRKDGENTAPAARILTFCFHSAGIGARRTPTIARLPNICNNNIVVFLFPRSIRPRTPLIACSIWLAAAETASNLRLVRLGSIRFGD